MRILVLIVGLVIVFTANLASNSQKAKQGIVKIVLSNHNR